MRALDFGDGKKLCCHSSKGQVAIPPVRKGNNPAEKFAHTVDMLLNGDNDLFGLFPGDDIVLESPTIGSSGADPELIRKVVSASERDIWLISARAVKNFKRTHAKDLKGDEQREALCEILSEKGVITEDISTDDELSAAIIYYLATENADRLKRWQFSPQEEKFRRSTRTVRPHDKRLYQGDEPDRVMALLPDFFLLPKDMQEVFGDAGSYNRSRTMPFAQALEEEISGTRAGYEKVLGLYGHGYPSHYRRATENLRQYIAKKTLGVAHIDDLSRDQHKESLRVTRYYVRRLYHMAQGKIDPVKGDTNPVPCMVSAGSQQGKISPAKGNDNSAGITRLDQLKGKSHPVKGNSDPGLFEFVPEF